MEEQETNMSSASNNDPIPLYQLRTFSPISGFYVDLTILSDLISGSCPSCGRGYTHPPTPFVVARSYDRYDPNEGPFGDFNALGRFDIVSDKLRRVLESISSSVRFDRCIVAADPERQKKAGKRKAARFAEELARDSELILWRLKVPTCYQMDDVRSGRSFETVCNICGYRYIKVAPNSHVVIERQSWGGEHLFQVIGCGEQLKGDAEFFGPTFMTPHARDILMQHQLSNLVCFQFGFIE
jgi:hypothetical protein